MKMNNLQSDKSCSYSDDLEAVFSLSSSLLAGTRESLTLAI